MTEDEFRSISDLVAETDEAISISKFLHDCLVKELKRTRESYPELGEVLPLHRSG